MKFDEEAKELFEVLIHFKNNDKKKYEKFDIMLVQPRHVMCVCVFFQSENLAEKKI